MVKLGPSPRVLIDGPIDDRDAGVLETAKGSILVDYVHVSGLRGSAEQSAEDEAG